MEALNLFLKNLRNVYLSRWKLRKYKIGKNFRAGRNVSFWAKNHIIIGDSFSIGRDSQIECDAIIGDNVIFANSVALIGRYDHNYQQIGTPIRFSSRIMDQDYSWKGLNSQIVIHDDVWVGYGAIILSGVIIGMGSIIAAGSVVTKDVEPFSIYGGIPAKKLGNRFENDEDLDNHIKIYMKNYNSIPLLSR